MNAVHNPERHPVQPYPVPSVHRAFRLLEILAESLNGIGVSELARQSGWPKSSIYNILATLAQDGFVVQDRRSGHYRMTFKLFTVSGSIVQQIDIREIAYPFLVELSEATGETINLGILDGVQAIYVDTIPGPSVIRANTWPGKRLPCHRTALGKVLVAELSEDALTDIVNETGLEPNTPNTLTNLAALMADLKKVRQRGYAIDDEEDQIGMRCVGVAVKDYRGEIAAAISLTGLATRMPVERIPDIAQTVIRTANLISEQMGHFAAETAAR